MRSRQLGWLLNQTNWSPKFLLSPPISYKEQRMEIRKVHIVDKSMNCYLVFVHGVRHPTDMLQDSVIYNLKKFPLCCPPQRTLWNITTVWPSWDLNNVRRQTQWLKLIETRIDDWVYTTTFHRMKMFEVSWFWGIKTSLTIRRWTNPRMYTTTS